MADYNFMVVEDSPTMRQLLVFSLKRIRNSKVVEANNGVEALKKLATETFHLLIVDINMPLMDGLKLLTIMRGDPRYKDIPIILATTVGADTDRDRGLKLGANAYLAKPIQTHELLKKVKEILNIPT